jgi:hypothetical protein
MGKVRRNPGNIDRCEPVCVECGSRGKLVSGAQACPDKPQRARDLFFMCQCGAWVSCHVGTGMAMGRPGSARTRYWRTQAHQALDSRWRRADPSARSGAHGFMRRKAYAWLAGALGIAVEDCHIGRFTEAECRRVIAACRVRDRRAA